jgi:hypothetical protein
VKALTPRQAEVLAFIETSIRGGLQPTFREIARALRINSTNGVNDHLLALEKKGYIRRGAGHARYANGALVLVKNLRATHTVEWLVTETRLAELGFEPLVVSRLVEPTPAPQGASQRTAEEQAAAVAGGHCRRCGIRPIADGSVSRCSQCLIVKAARGKKSSSAKT